MASERRASVKAGRWGSLIHITVLSDGHHQHIPHSFCLLKIPDMTDMQEVKADILLFFTTKHTKKPVFFHFLPRNTRNTRKKPTSFYFLPRNTRNTRKKTDILLFFKCLAKSFPGFFPGKTAFANRRQLQRFIVNHWSFNFDHQTRGPSTDP